MMGSRLSGDRSTPRAKLPKELKSRLIQTRLDPKKPDQKKLLDRLAVYFNNGWTLRLLLEHGIDAIEGRDSNRYVAVDGQELIEVRQIVQYIMDKLESGAFVSQVAPRTSRKKNADMQLSANVRDALDHYLSGGITADDED
jgi:hypothetical protein